MEPSVIIVLVVSCCVSFALGRTFVYFRDKKKRQVEEVRKAMAQRRQMEAQRDEPESLNKAKRKRQLQQSGKGGKPGQGSSR